MLYDECYHAELSFFWQNATWFLQFRKKRPKICSSNYFIGIIQARTCHAANYGIFFQYTKFPIVLILVTIKGDQFQILSRLDYLPPSYQNHIKSMLCSN